MNLESILQLDLLPITVVAAICLFALKEAIEGIRRRQTMRRRVGAIKALLAMECELNNWTVSSIKSILNSVKDGLGAEPRAEFEVHFQRSGKVRFKSKAADGSYTASNLSPIHSEQMKHSLLEIATFGGRLYRRALSTHEAIKELEHVRESLIYFLNPDDEADRVHLEGFLEYGFEQLPRISTALEDLYRECTGRPLEKHRIR